MKAAKYLSILLVLALILCLLPAAALADPADEGEDEEVTEPAPEEPADPAEEEEPEEPADPEEPEEPAAAEETEEAEEDAPVIVAQDETGYAMPGQTVYNNGGTVYNNGALVYNNGGLVYLNDGTVYNNGGVVYANGGTVYNNGGTVYRNEALVYSFENDGVVENRIYGSYKVTLAEDYSALADIEGLEKDMYLAEDGVCTITPHEGLVITAAQADAGVLTEKEDGSWTLEKVDADLTLTLSFRTEAPSFDLEEGTYSEEQTLTITAPAGAEIYYTLDGSEPREDNSQLYAEPLTLTEGVTVTAVAIIPGAEPSEAVAADYAFVTITVPAFAVGQEGKDPPKAAAFRVANEGDVDAKIESVKLEGENAKSFKLSSEKGATVKAGKTNSSNWTVQPVTGLEKGQYTASVVFTLDSGETVTLDISYTVN
jgi:adhesin HecA-like repeat protein